MLLEGLTESGLDFIFKGGTALMLLQGLIKRLSIDIDILVTDKIDPEPYFKKFIKNKNFIRFEFQDREKNSSIEKAHYKFFYKPVYNTAQTEEQVLLDILFEESQYKKIESINIDSSFVQQDGPALKINVPSFEDMLGDKLTAFAPNTSGIPYEKNGHSKAMEIIKQLYDIGNLFDVAKDLKTVRDTFSNFALTELAYRKLKQKPGVILNDIFETSLCISTRGAEGNGDFAALQDGISRVRAFIFSESYQIEKAIIHAAKAAYLSKLVETKNNKIERFENAMQIADWDIQQPFYTRLNKLKKSNPQAFFYWYKTYKLVKGI
ncbi:MAG: nucleotidyl transferase AbiEii/AbiGii toxin family protein [Calditrichaceae bacterium]|nr:nucleotidyl transferase AbiEii/AbiGii toxin family protein [Calditrichaceae bacterium]MBN2708574.1 nucleotidyl transferase AbiEii/AbiGii toxin family protein [Calditrichaceae bacterium]